MAGIYVHFPFCSSFCIYCDFYSEIGNGSTETYTGALLREMNVRKGFFHSGVVPDTLYFGGGTPSIVPAEELSRVARGAKETFGVKEFAEFTMEANPDDVSVASLEGWLAAGVNRLSLGVQSFNDASLKWMRRRHDAAGAVRAVTLARKAGFGNISIDLIFGYAGLEMKEWEASIDTAVSLGVQHVSCYQMSVEKGSALGGLASRGGYAEPPQEECAAQYAILQRMLSAAGFRQYEISNFALPGFESRHNSAYWNRNPYLGLGAAAHSFDGERRRSWNVADLKRYVSGISDRDFEGVAEGETLSAGDVADETIMLGLRRTAGFDARIIEEPFRAPFLEKAALMEKKGLLERCGTSFRIPSDKLFVSDDIISDLFP